MPSANDNISLKDGGDNPFKMRAIDVSLLGDGTVQLIRHYSTLYPADYGVGGSYHTTVKSGAMAVGLGATAPILAFRNPSANLLAVLRRIKFEAWSTGTGFAAGLASIDMSIARSFSVQDTGGAAVSLTSPQAKLRAAMSASSSLIQVATTGALTAGTRTKDTNPIEALRIAVGTATNTPFIPFGTELYKKQGSDHPVVLALNEGFVLEATVPGTGTWAWASTLEWDELPISSF
jgi:hypothetical protein